jgi:hypothetical protein
MLEEAFAVGSKHKKLVSALLSEHAVEAVQIARDKAAQRPSDGRHGNA